MLGWKQEFIRVRWRSIVVISREVHKGKMRSVIIWRVGVTELPQKRG